MLDEVGECNYRISVDKDRCSCSNGIYSYKGVFNTDFCKTCPIANKMAEPTLSEKIANLGKAAIKHAASGFKNADSEETERRKSICETCDQFDKEKSLCRQCGCFMNIKTIWLSSTCPLGKWENKDK